MIRITQVNAPVVKVIFSDKRGGFTPDQKRLLEDAAQEHVDKQLMSSLSEAGDRVFVYWLAEFIWGKYIPNQIRQLQGIWTYGYGYVLLSDRHSFFVNLGHVVDKLFTPGRYTSPIFPNEPRAEELERRSLVNKVPWLELDFANDNCTQPLIDGQVWKIQDLQDFHDSNSFFSALKYGHQGLIEKWFIKHQG